MKNNNNLININKKLGVSTKWTFLEGFAVYGGGEIYEVYKFGETLDFNDKENPFYKEREKSEEIRRMMTKTHFVIRSFAGGRKYLDKKYFINTQAQKSEKYPHHTEDIIAYLRKVVNSKYVFWDLEKYFRYEEYESLWDIYSFSSLDWRKGTSLASNAFPLPVIKTWVKRWDKLKISYNDLWARLVFSVNIPDGVFEMYSKPIKVSGGISLSYILNDVRRIEFKEGWKEVLRKGIQDKLKDKPEDNLAVTLLEEEGRMDREKDIRFFPSKMRKEIIDFFTDKLASFMIERLELGFKDVSELLNIEDDEEFVKLFDVKARYPEFDNTGGIFFKAKLGNHTMYSNDVSPDFEKIEKIHFFDNLEPNDIIRGGNFLDILVPSWKTPGIWIGFHIPLDTIRNALKYYRYCGEGIKSAIKLILIGQYINKEDSRDLPLDYIVKAININTGMMVDISALFEYDSIGRFVDNTYAYYVVKDMLEFSTIKELDKLKYTIGDDDNE